MTAAFGELTGPAVRGRAGRFLCVLALVLPVPLCAALGLSLPLPATVERIAAKLVPFGDADALDSNPFAVGARGSIALAPGEGDRSDVNSAVPVGSAGARTEARMSGKADPATGAGPRTDKDADAGASTPATGTERTTSPSTPQDPAAAPSAAPSSGGAGEGTTQPGGGSDPDPGGEPQIVDTVVNTTNGAVETVTNTAESTTDSATEAVESVTDTGTGALGEIKPP